MLGTILDDLSRCLGYEVRSSDEQMLGTVVKAHPEFLTVQHGSWSDACFYVPIDAVRACEGGAVFLCLTRDDVARAVWDLPFVSDQAAD
jgi:hypothetical protein